MIVLDAGVLAAIRSHAESTYPEECCGALVGEVAAGRRTVRRALRLQNARAEARRRRFRIEPEDYRGAERSAAAHGLDLIGFYHSHPDHPAAPSEYDREHALPWHSYVIVAVAAGRAGACTSWVLSADRSRFESEEVRA